MGQRIKLTIFIIVISVSNLHIGKSFAASSSSNKNIEETCATSPVACLKRIDAALAGAPKSDRIKFDLLQYRYVALFNLQRIAQLHKETSQWLDKPNLPIAFSITVYIYFAKSAMAMEDENISQEYADKAIALLNDMQQAFPSPIRIIELANLKMQYGQIESAYRLLMELEQKFINSKNAYFQLELTGNLAHITQRLKKYDKSLTYWQTARHWAEVYGNLQQQAVVYYNTGYLYQLTQSHQEAIEVFLKARTIATKAQDTAKVNQVNFRLAQSYFKLGQTQQAIDSYQLVKLQHLPITEHPEFEQLRHDFSKLLLKQ